MKRALIPVIRRTKFVWKECRVGKVSFLFFSWKDRVPYRPTRSNQDDFSADRLATNQQMEWAT